MSSGKKATKERPPEPKFNCVCCLLNFETMKAQLDASGIRGKSGGNAEFTDPFVLFSRPEPIPCDDCEGLKIRFSNYMGSTLTFRKDRLGFIEITCKPENAFYLLKGTAVLNYYMPPQLQGFIKFK